MLFRSVIARVPSAIETVGAKLPPGFPPNLFESVTHALRAAVDQMQKEPPS